MELKKKRLLVIAISTIHLLYAFPMMFFIYGGLIYRLTQTHVQGLYLFLWLFFSYESLIGTGLLLGIVLTIYLNYVMWRSK